MDCSPDKAPLFVAAGCTVRQGARQNHHYPNPPPATPPKADEHWSGNKIAHNLGRHPLPSIGSVAELWDELLSVKLTLEPPEGTRKEVENFLDGMSRPLILLHPKANTSPDKKNLSDDTIKELYRGLRASTGGTVIVLDWDDRTPPGEGVRFVSKEFRKPDVFDLFALMEFSQLLIGVDSGPLHFARFTEIPSIGVWRGHHPHQFALPHPRHVHYCHTRHQDWNKCRRKSFQICDYDGPEPKAEDLVALSAMVLEEPGLAACRRWWCRYGGL